MGFKITLIRHGKTKSNSEGKFLGKTDETLIAEGIAELQNLWQKPPEGELVYTSPMLRCIDSIRFIAPELEYKVIDDLRELDFGEFEGKTDEDLQNLKEFIEFRKTKGLSDIPGGEKRADFIDRTIKAFDEIIDDMVDSRLSNAIVICHGGSIMSILSELNYDKNDFYEYLVENGHGYIVDYDIFDEKLKILAKF